MYHHSVGESTVVPSNLPVELTSLVGRAREIEELRRLVGGGARFVTLTGPGGSGKTRLGREVARALTESFPDGAYLVSLAPVSDPGIVASVIAQTLDLREAAPTLQTLEAFLKGKNLLLLVDNFEHVLEASPLVPQLLRNCPRLCVLVTSRTALRVEGEREFPVPPLAIPDLRHLPGVEELSAYASVSLFIDRARAVLPSLDAHEAALRDIAGICARLDGLPLAIELAAARTKVLSPRAMLSRLTQGQPIPGGGPRDLPERQRTLRATIGWSYNLLTPAEQAVFRCLSVFRGGCELESVEAIYDQNRDASEDLLEVIASLLDNNLVRQVESGGTSARFGMLETIREFGLEMLAACGELAVLQEHHAEHFLGLAEAAAENIPGPEQESWLHLLEREHDNLRAALRWQIAHERAAEALSLSAALEQFWQFRGYVIEGRGWLEESLAMDRSQTDTTARGRALTALGMLALYQSDFDGAKTAHENALRIFRNLNDPLNSAIAINDLGTVALYQGNYASAHAHFNESLALRQKLGDRRGSAVCLTNLGIVAQIQGDLATARALLERGLATRREMDDSPGITRSLTRLGAVATEQVDYRGARTYLQESLALAREAGDERAMASCLTALGTVATALGNISEGRALLEEGLAIRRRLQDRSGILRSLWHLLQIPEIASDLSAARKLWEESLPLQEETGDKRGTALWLAGLAGVLEQQGEYAAAEERLERSLALRRQIRDDVGAAVITGKIAQLRFQLGDIKTARDLLDQSVAELRQHNDRQALSGALTNLAQLVESSEYLHTSETLYIEALALREDNPEVIRVCLMGLAKAAQARGDLQRAAQLLGALEGITDRCMAAPSNEAPRITKPSTVFDPTKGDAAIEQAWSKGRTMSPQEAIDFALDGASESEASTVAPAFPDDLSEREVEVLRLISDGKSNPEIASELFISVNTVYRHVSHIFVKTGSSNRVEAASYAREHGLTVTAPPPE
jgi:predicted ATPase/DNA-binding CsgD family transcriptional regulator